MKQFTFAVSSPDELLVVVKSFGAKIVDTPFWLKMDDICTSGVSSGNTCQVCI